MIDTVTRQPLQLEQEIDKSGNLIENFTSLIKNKETFRKLVKFGIVGSTGAVITWGGTWILTERLGLWYMTSVILATVLAILWNFLWNLKWTFAQYPDVSDPEYEWYSFYHGNVFQKWWKRSIAKTVWGWVPNEKILDVGCGSSPIISRYSNAVGLDTNAQKLVFMHQKLPNRLFINSKLEDRKFRNEMFDDIICIEVIEHCEHPSSIISEISRVVKNGGKVVIATPDYSKPLWHLAELFTAYKKEHISKFTRESLENICLYYGLKPVKYKYILGCDLIEEFRKV